MEIKFRRMRWTCSMNGSIRSAYRCLVGTSERKILLGDVVMDERITRKKESKINNNLFV
jgi:hypothetical protein